MSPRERLFVAEYIRDLNATKAAIRAGYSEKTARQIGSRLLTKVHIQKAIAAALEERNRHLKIDADRLLGELIEENNADLADLYDESGNLKSIHDWPLVWRRGLVQGIEVEEIYEGKGEDRVKIGEVRKLKISDRLKRKELIGRHTKVQAWKDKVQHDLTDPLKKLAAQILGNSIRPKDDGSGNAGGNGPNPMVRE